MHALQFVREYPDGAPVRERDVRAKRLLHFPYTILYRVVGESVFVLAVACQLRDPDAYDDRLH